MSTREKLKPWAFAMIALYVVGAVLMPVMFVLWVLDESEIHIFGCHHGTNPIVAMELVSQEKPLAFYELMEEPRIEGIKVRLTYEDGGSEVVDAYQAKRHEHFGRGGFEHEKGMFFHQISDIYQPFLRPALEPGIHLVPMYGADVIFDLDGDPEFAEEPGYAHCMVEVYAQTGDEYLAGHDLPSTTVTPSEDGTLALKGDEWRGLVRLLAEESGVYAFTIEGGCFFFTHEYTGSGAVFEGEYHTPESLTDVPSIGPDFSAWMDEFYQNGYYARLKANEPVFVPIYLSWPEKSASVRISLARLPEIEIALGETIEITQPSALRIKGYDTSKAWARPDDWADDNLAGCYILTGTDYDHYSEHDRNFHPAVLDGHVIVPKAGKTATVTLRLGE